MLSTLRRCRTSVRWSIVSRAAKSNPQFLSTPSTFLASQVSPKLLAAVRTLHLSSRNLQNAATAAHEADADYPSQGAPAGEAADTGRATKFAQLAERSLVDKVIIRTLTQTMGLETMTEVQSLTINEALKGKDVLAQAKTGTGKTIGFLLPIIQRIVAEDSSLATRGRKVRTPRFGERASDIRAIIISPTRELAEQIAAEAKKLLQDTSIVVQTAVGGTQKTMHLRAMQREGCHILVGTPGRLKDILSDRETGVEAPKLSAFVLDEADRLLDQGFWPEIQAIQDLLPTRQEKDRQTLMFSATVPEAVVKLVRTVMKPDLHYVRTVQDNEEPTHERVKQMLVTVPGFENLLPTVLELCQREATNRDRARPFKAIVYYNATAEATLASSIFFNIRRAANDSRSSSAAAYLPDTRIFEIHSRLTQRQRSAAADHFRGATSAILMSSDVTARGMDFPGVTHVIQVGVPNERDTYIHRLGRTARAGQEGEGWLILADATIAEARSRLGKLPLQKDTSLSASQVDFEGIVADEIPEGLTPEAQETFDAVSRAARKVEPEELERTYLAMLGTFQWLRDKHWLIASMNRLTKVSWGMERPPSVSRGLASKLGLLGVPGINFGGGARGAFGASDGGRSGGGGGRGGRGRDGGREVGRGDAPPRRFGEIMERSGGGGGERGFGDRSDRYSSERSERGGGGGGRGSGGGSGGSRFPSHDRNDRRSSGGFGGGSRGGGGGGSRGGFGGGGSRGGGGRDGGGREGGREGGGREGGFGGAREGGRRGGFGGR